MARVAAVLVVGLLVLRLLPGFLRAPEPPPLAADVGLPKVAPLPHTPRPRKHLPQKSRPRPVKDAPASKAVIGSKHRHRVVAKPAPHPAKPVESPPPPVPEYVPPAAPEPVSAPLPEPPPALPSTPGDGSQEFAPH